MRIVLDTDDLAKIKAIVDASIHPLIVSIQAMTKTVDDLVAADAAQSTAIAGLTTAIGNLVTLANTLKADLTAAIANSGMTAADQAALQAIIDKHTADSAAIAASAQKIADALVVDQPGN